MSNKLSPHDRLFKTAMEKQQAAKNFFQENLPEQIKNKVNLDTLQLEKDTFIDVQLRSYLVDVLFSVDLEDKKRGYIYILCEHQSKPDEMLPLRMLEYVVRIMKHHLNTTGSNELPVVYPMIFYTGQQQYNYSTDFFDLFGEKKELVKQIFLQPYQLVNVDNIPNRDFLTQQTVHCDVMITLFKYHKQDADGAAEKVEPYLKILNDIGDTDYIFAMVQYMAEAKDVADKNQFFKKITANLSKEAEVKIMSIAQQFREEGEQMAMQKANALIEEVKRNEIEKITKIAINLLQSGLSEEKVASTTGLPLAQIKKLATSH